MLEQQPVKARIPSPIIVLDTQEPQVAKVQQIHGSDLYGTYCTGIKIGLFLLTRLLTLALPEGRASSHCGHRAWTLIHHPNGICQNVFFDLFSSREKIK